MTLFIASLAATLMAIVPIFIASELMKHAVTYLLLTPPDYVSTFSIIMAAVAVVLWPSLWFGSYIYFRFAPSLTDASSQNLWQKLTTAFKLFHGKENGNYVMRLSVVTATLLTLLMLGIFGLSLEANGQYIFNPVIRFSLELPFTLALPILMGGILTGHLRKMT